MSSLNGKKLRISSSQEYKIKYEMHDFKHENNKIVHENIVKNKNNHQPRAHIIMIYNSSSVSTL